jgi:hypothetical protein
MMTPSLTRLRVALRSSKPLDEEIALRHGDEQPPTQSSIEFIDI